MHLMQELLDCDDDFPSLCDEYMDGKMASAMYFCSFWYKQYKKYMFWNVIRSALSL